MASRSVVAASSWSRCTSPLPRTQPSFPRQKSISASFRRLAERNVCHGMSAARAATELILSGRQFDAREALDLGLVNRIVTSRELLKQAMALAEDLATKPPLTLAAALWAIHHGMDASIDDGLAIEEAAFARIVPTKDANEGVAAFVQKRRPEYSGL